MCDFIVDYGFLGVAAAAFGVTYLTVEPVKVWVIDKLSKLLRAKIN